MPQIHQVLPLANPSFETFQSQMGDGSWSQEYLFPGRSYPVGWTIGPEGAMPFCDLERYTRKSEHGLKVCLGPEAQGAWFVQKVSGLTPIEEYGFGGWVMRREFGNDDPAAQNRSRVGYLLSLTAETDRTKVEPVWLEDTRNAWFWFGEMFTAPAGGEVSLWLFMESFFPANNVFYLDHFDDPEIGGGTD